MSPKNEIGAAFIAGSTMQSAAPDTEAPYVVPPADDVRCRICHVSIPSHTLTGVCIDHEEPQP